MKKSLGASERIRQALGALVLAGVAAISLGLDTRVLAKLSSAQTTGLESALAQSLGVAPAMNETGPRTSKMGQLALPSEGTLPEIKSLGIGPWFNSQPLVTGDLRGRVVLIDFWTYSCINCLRSIPYVKAWDERYRKDGLVVIGVHAPEFAFERDSANVAKAVKDLGIRYPVVMDNDWKLWRALHNNYWPAHYFIDAEGRVRFHHFGEGKYDTSERVIRQLLSEAGRSPGVSGSKADATGLGAAGNRAERKSPETYIGYARADRFASPGGLLRDQTRTYKAATLKLNQWSFEGAWQDQRQSARSLSAGAKINFRFHARDLHLVLGSTTAKPIRFRLLIDGKAPGRNAGVDTLPDGTGVVTGQRLYQLIRQSGPIEDRTFTIEFLDPSVDAFSFTFG
jgi:thiol-disulfide isomerase/thioredoxin